MAFKDAHVIKAANGLIIPKLAADPSTPEDGAIWYNTSTNEFKSRQNGNTVVLGADTVAAEDVSYDNATSSLTATDVQAAIDEVEGRLDNAETDLFGHTSALSGAHDASAISFNPTGSIASTDVQAAVAELDTDLTNHLNDTADAHDASAISVGPLTGGPVGDDVQEVLQELATMIDGHIDDTAGAHHATAIAFDDTGLSIVADEVQAAIEEVLTLAESISQGLTAKGAVIFAYDTNLALSGSGELSQGAVMLSDGDFVLLTDQTSSVNNGVYTYTYSAPNYSLARSPHFDGSPTNEVKGGDWVYVLDGDLAGTSWVVNGAGAIDVGTDPLVFTEFNKMTPLSAGSAIDLTGGSISVKVDDTTIEIVGDELQIKDNGVSAAKVRLANNTSLRARNQANDGDVDLIKVGTDNKAAFGTDINLGDRVLIHGSNGIRKGSSDSAYWEEEYIDSITLSTASPNTVISDLSLAHATHEGMQVEYKIKEATTNTVAVGTIYVVTNGTDTSIVDTGVGTAEMGLTWNLNINGATTELRYTKAGLNATMRCVAKRIKA